MSPGNDQIECPESTRLQPENRVGGFFPHPRFSAAPDVFQLPQTHRVELTFHYETASGVLYYGFRFYDPNAGRWLSRDPIEEDGGANIYATVENEAVNRFDALGLYGESGHFYTTYIIATLANPNNQRNAYELAYYSQLPDEHPYFDAINALLPWNVWWNKLWAYNVQRELHSLHGGAATKRRACLKRMLVGKCGGPLNTWEKGFIIHAFADSYAHTDPNGNLYTFPLGHFNVFMPDKGKETDYIADRPGLYLEYAYELFDALGGKDRSRLDDLVRVVQSLSPYDDELETVPKFREYAIDLGYSKGYYPEDFENVQEAAKHGKLPVGTWLPTPTTAKVGALMQKIKKCCGCN